MRTAAVVGGVALALAAPAAAAPSSLYSGPGPRPGPAILYEKPARSPQLVNAGVWRAKPTLVSGTSAYRDGEFLYQDFIYDDHGARATADPNDPRTSGNQFSAPNGTYTYPTAAKYANNAADLVELRVKPLARATAFRITLNTLKDPSLVGTTIAIGGSKKSVPFPFGANVSAPAKLFLTVHGTTAELDSAISGKRISPDPKVSISKRRRQIQVLVPHSAWNPRRSKVRLAAGVGLWDTANDSYLTPQGSADVTRPGGAGGLSNPPAFFNVAFRYREPWPDLKAGGGTDAVFDPAWWRDKAQAAALATGDISPFHAVVDFSKLARRVHDNGAGKPWGVPKTGPMDRILVSHFHAGQGANYAKTCGEAQECIGELRGQLQPYAIYVPRKPPPKKGYGLTLLLHSLAASYNQFGNTRNQSQFGDRGPGSIVITPEGRGPDGWYWGQAGADTFEVWAEVARLYHLDPRWTAIAGYSMGGYGTYKFATQYPDLFARAQPTVGPPGLGIWVPPNPPVPGGAASNTNSMLASVRNIPFLIWDGTNDELVPVPGPVAQAQTFDDLGYRYEFDLFDPPVDHLLLAANDQYAPAAKFLGTAKVDRNPFHVTYVVNPKMDFPKDGTVANHAYWLSGLRLRNAGGDNPLGKVDAISQAFGRADPEPKPTQHGTGSLEGGNVGTFTYTSQSRSWGPVRKAAKADALKIHAKNLSRIVVHPRRAKLDCGAKLDVKTDGPLDVKLAGCGRAHHFS